MPGIVTAFDRNHQRQVRPFYFVSVVWGERYRNYFLEYCLPSLLAPDNIPGLAGLRSAYYVLATTASDWDAMRGTAIFRELERHATPIFLELPPCPESRPYWRQAILGHKLCCELIVAQKAYRIFVTPDSVFSNGMVIRLHQLALAGKEIVLKLTSPSVKTEQWFDSLARLGLVPAASARDTGLPLAFSSRQLVTAQLLSMHGEFLIHEWEAPYFGGFASTPWWRVPGGEGLVVCGLVWDVWLLDYAAIPHHDISIFDDRGTDGDYFMRNASDFTACHFVRDTDEFQVVGWQSYADPPRERRPLGEFGKGAGFRTSYYSAMYNDLHRALLLLPMRVHAGDTDEKWAAIEDEALRTLLSWVDLPDYARSDSALPIVGTALTEAKTGVERIRLPLWRRNGVSWWSTRAALIPLYARLVRARNSIRRFWLHSPVTRLVALSPVLLHRAAVAMRGNRAMRQWWRWRFRKLFADATGREFREPMPELPE